MLDEIYKEYGTYFYLPMTQGYSVAVPVTVGCSWDRCLYCDLNHGNKFRFLGFDAIEQKLIALKNHYAARRRPVGKIVLAGGNPFCLDAGMLIKIAVLIKEYFPQVQNISSFARADDILKKTPEELIELKKVGMGELSIGIESGNDEVLAFHHKGVTREDNHRAMSKLKECGISYSAYVMLGLGGQRLSREHALDTASLLSLADPQVITLVTLVLFKDARLVEKVRQREFIRLSLMDSIREEKILLEHLDMRNTIFNGTHKTNALLLKGKLPEQKGIMLGRVDQVLKEADQRTMTSKEILKWKNWSLE